jgi:hypothetical protein
MQEDRVDLLLLALIKEAEAEADQVLLELMVMHNLLMVVMVQIQA